jgi:hypothetical protein
LMGASILSQALLTYNIPCDIFYRNAKILRRKRRPCSTWGHN